MIKADKIMIDIGTEQHWLTRPTTIRWLWRGGLITLVLVTLASIWVNGDSHFGVDGTFGFYSWFGFFASIAILVLAWFIGKIFGREKTDYDI